jgi:spore germination protein YaaH
MVSRRVPALLASVALIVGVVSPVAADDPSSTASSPSASPSPESVTGWPTIHADALEEHAGNALAFPEGAKPAPLTGAGGVAALGVASLPAGMTGEVYGYLPYWALSTSLLAQLEYDLVSTIAYFGVPVTDAGRLATTGSGPSGWNSSLMTGVINQAHAHGVAVHLTVTMMAWDGDYTAMTALLTSSSNRTRLANEIAATVKARNADGVNLDFEPMPNSLQTAYTAFVRDVKAALVAAGAGSALTVATTGGAASWDEGYDLPALVATGAADAIMAMGYDYNWAGSQFAGGVAPLDSSHVLDVRSALSDYLAKVPASKLIWGVPYYGRAWTTQSSAQNSSTCRTTAVCPGGTASAIGRSWAPGYPDAVAAAAQYGRRWDAIGGVAWYRYQSSTYGTWVQGYYDDATSLRLKHDLVRSRGLRGVGIWHLLMDGSRNELWNELAWAFADAPFADIWSSPFRDDIVWLAEAGITNGCGDVWFCPTGSVTRAQMASFLARALDLPASATDYFSDDSGLVYEPDINRVAAAGITLGCDTGRYCPSTPVSRDQMASFLARALELPDSATDYFGDDTGSLHEADINRIAAAGISNGCRPGFYCPSSVVTREQMAAFLHRALGD